MNRLFFAVTFCLVIIRPYQSYSQQLPIKPARTISFTTDEGSYINVDVSPDGKTLVFDLLGDLYTVPAVGGKATQITRGIALNLKPVWSPDGKRIAYISDNSGDFHLNVMDYKGVGRQVLGARDPAINYYNYDSNPLWIPGGAYITINGYIYGLAGGKMSTGITVQQPVGFSSDGQFTYGLDSGRLYRYDQSRKIHEAISPVLQRFQSATLSPDAKWWCYITDSNARRCLVALDLTKDVKRVIVSSLIEKDPRYKPFGPTCHFAFSPDSKNIFIGYGGKIHRIDIETGDDNMIPFTAAVKCDLGAFNYHTYRILNDSVNIKYTRSANASPDDRHLVFSALDRIYVMALPNGKPHVLAPQPVAQFQPVYSPDGQWIAYVSWSDTAGGYLWRVQANGGQPQRLTAVPGQYQRPAWSPDGNLIAVVRGKPRVTSRDDPGIGRLEVVHIDGGPITTIDDSVPLWNSLTFSGDGSKVIYTRKWDHEQSNGLIPELVSKDLNGNDRQVVAAGTGFTFYQQKAISPDGRFMVYSADEDLYLVPVCQLTVPYIISDDKQQLSVIRFASGVDPYWEKGGQVLAWTYGNRFYRIDPDKIMAAAEKSGQEEQSAANNNFVTVEVNPDEEIHMNVTVPTQYAHGELALTNVRIITMDKAKVIEHGTILIKDGRFLAVGPGSAVTVPKGVKVIDLPGATAMPGIVDLHLHMQIPPNVFPQQSWMFLANLAYGVTTARDPALSFDSFGYAELLESGDMIGPRLFTVGRAVAIPRGVVRMDNLSDARSVVHKRAMLGGTEIKQYTLPSRIQKQWLLMACREYGLNMTNEGASDPIMQFGMIKDGSTGVEHNPEWGDIYHDVTSLVAHSGVYLTPTLQVCNGAEMGKEYLKFKYWHQMDPKLAHFTFSDPSQDGPTSNGAESIETILKAEPKDTINPGFLTPARIDAEFRHHGARIALGSHGNDEGIGAQNELWALQMGGLSNMETLQAATIVGAEALGIQKDLGSIEVGKIADLIILNKNPLEDIHNSREIRYVMKDGILYDGNTLDEIWPIVKKCPEWKFKGNASAPISISTSE